MDELFKYLPLKTILIMFVLCFFMVFFFFLLVQPSIACEEGTGEVYPKCEINDVTNFILGIFLVGSLAIGNMAIMYMVLSDMLL